MLNADCVVCIDEDDDADNGAKLDSILLLRNVVAGFAPPNPEPTGLNVLVEIPGVHEFCV